MRLIHSFICIIIAVPGPVLGTHSCVLWLFLASSISSSNEALTTIAAAACVAALPTFSW